MLTACGCFYIRPIAAYMDSLSFALSFCALPRCRTQKGNPRLPATVCGLTDALRPFFRGTASLPCAVVKFDCLFFIFRRKKTAVCCFRVEKEKAHSNRSVSSFFRFYRVAASQNTVTLIIFPGGKPRAAFNRIAPHKFRHRIPCGTTDLHAFPAQPRLRL